jgi:WD40 repeat protein
LVVVLLVGAAFAAIVAVRQRNRADENVKQGTMLLYVANMNLAKSAFDQNRWARGYALLEGYLPGHGVSNLGDLREFYWRYLWKENRNEELTIGREVDGASLAFSNDGEVLATGGWDGRVKVWNRRLGTAIATLGAHEEEVASIAFTAGGTQLLSSSIDGTVKLWDVRKGKELNEIHVEEDLVTEDEINWVSFSPDGRTLASTVAIVDGDKSGDIELWDVASGRKRATIKGESANVFGMAFSKDGRVLASGNGNGTIGLRDAASGRQMKVIKRDGGPIRSIAFSSDGSTLACGSESGSVTMWNARTGREVTTFEGHSGYVRDVAFDGDGGLLVSGSDDGTAKVWDTRTGLLVRTLTGHTDAVGSVSFSPNGELVAGGSSDGSVKL